VLLKQLQITGIKKKVISSLKIKKSLPHSRKQHQRTTSQPEAQLDWRYGQWHMEAASRISPRQNYADQWPPIVTCYPFNELKKSGRLRFMWFMSHVVITKLPRLAPAKVCFLGIRAGLLQWDLHGECETLPVIIPGWSRRLFQKKHPLALSQWIGIWEKLQENP